MRLFLQEKRELSRVLSREMTQSDLHFKKDHVAAVLKTLRELKMLEAEGPVKKALTVNLRMGW